MPAPKILIIDDEQSIINLVSAYLRPEGYEVYSATNGPGGLKTAHSLKPDLIVLDIMLPGLDGIQLLTQLRRDSGVYIIMLTAKTKETDKIIDLSVGADDYLIKPFSPRELSLLNLLQSGDTTTPLNQTEIQEWERVVCWVRCVTVR